jgi:prepilin-type N-terminal cleavage/methylation domain-containing protein
MRKDILKNEKGFTLLEVLVAVFVLAIVALPLLNMFVYNTAVVRKTADMQDTTYAAQAVMEKLQPLGYGELYALAPAPGARGEYSINSVTRTISIDRYPYGPFNHLVSGTACYAHLIVRGSTATFTCPDGSCHAGLSYASGVSVTASSVTLGGHTYSLNKPAGSRMILIINAGSSAIPALTVTLDSSVPYVLYALAEGDANAQNITVNNGNPNSKQYRKFNSSGDPPPSYMLVNAVCKTYGAGGAVESLAQDTLKVRLP